MARNKKKSSGIRTFMKVICVFLGIVLVLLLGATIFVNSFLNQINRVEDEQPTLSDAEIESILNEVDEEDDGNYEEMDPEDVTLPETPALKLEDDEHIVNILLIGQDRRPGQGRQRSDAMILCTINTEKKTLVMTSFLRDLYVKLPEYNGNTYLDNRINTTYAIGGMEMLNDCLELNFGVEVDHNIEVDFSGFEQIIDSMGGVDIELTQAEANWIGGGLRAGVNHLNGEQALAYSRIRKLDSDFGRTSRQRNVLSALLQQVKGLSLNQLLDLANTLMPMITTDMSNGDIVGYVMDFFPILSGLEVTTQSVPAEGLYTSAKIRGMSVLVPDLDAINEVLRDTIGS